MAYIGNLDLSNYKIHGNWTSGHGQKSYNKIRHISIHNVQFFEMTSKLKNINFVIDPEIYNKYLNHTWTALKRGKNYYLNISVKHNNKFKQISYKNLLKLDTFDNMFKIQLLKKKS